MNGLRAVLRAGLAALVLGAGATASFASPAFVGSAACTDCHAAQSKAWTGSHHQLAMQLATEKFVLGRFAGETFTRAGIVTKFFKRDGKYFVNTDGPGGKMADFEVKYTFGWTPLQQYLIELPGGRLQAFTLAWDSRPKEKGGQRWFDLLAKEKVRAGDELHWTGRQQNWNFMCADCHSTNLRKGYDAAKDTFDTKWSEITVGCESCHGPASNHIAWAKAGAAKTEASKGLTVLLDERRGVSWKHDTKTGNASRSKPRTTQREIEVCAQCHSRRAQLAEGYHAGKRFLDHYLPSLLEAANYEADGQQKASAEVYNWGPFLTSRMHEKGVTCSDCHDPHSGKTRAPGNAVCAQCHVPAKYDAPTHHRHKVGTAASECASCHMPTTTYMGIDARHDHGFKVPRPDLTVTLGTPNACGTCHAAKGAKWAAQSIEGWYGKDRRQERTFADALHAGRTRSAGAQPKLEAMLTDAGVPSLVRATALQSWIALPPAPSPNARSTIERGAADANPLVRLAAVRGSMLFPPEQRSALFIPLLTDAFLTVRVEAANALADTPGAVPGLDRALRDYRAVQAYNADRPEAWMNLGIIEAKQRDAAAASKAYAEALRRDPAFFPVLVNRADLERAMGDDAASVATLRQAVKIAPSNADAHHALGLALVRTKKMDAAVAELDRAAKLAPGNARYSYVLAIAQSETGQREAAIRTLEGALKRHPNDRNLQSALREFRAAK